MTLSKEVGLDSTLGARKNALLAHTPNTRAEMEQAEGVTRHYSRGDADHRRLMEAPFALPRPVIPLGAGQRHPADCGCGPCRTRRGKRTTNQTTTKGATA